MYSNDDKRQILIWIENYFKARNHHPTKDMVLNEIARAFNLPQPDAQNFFDEMVAEDLILDLPTRILQNTGNQIIMGYGHVRETELGESLRKGNANGSFSFGP